MEQVEIKEPAILLTINRLFKPNISPAELYEVTRGNWVLSERRNNAKYAFTVYQGVVREIYRILRWRPTPLSDLDVIRQDRWRFEGEVAAELHHYIGGNVQDYIPLGTRNPIRYINC